MPVSRSRKSNFPFLQSEIAEPGYFYAMKGTTSQGTNVRRVMRYLHNKIGFFLVGLVIIYALSGLIQTYRDTDLLKHEISHEKKLEPGLHEAELSTALKLRTLKVSKTEGAIIHFDQGTYDTSTGLAKWKTKEWYSWITPFTSLHKTASKSIAHYFTTLFGIAMLFMSISAFWMFKPGTKPFSSGVFLTIAGIVASILLLLL